MGNVKNYRIVAINRNGVQGTFTVSAKSIAEARGKFMAGHPGYKILEAYAL